MTLQVKKLAELDVRGKKVFIRADLNVPQDDAGNITEDTRIRASIPTLRYCLDHGAAVMVTSHLGRPGEGTVGPDDTLAPVAVRLGQLLGQPVKLVADWVDGGITVEPGQIVLLENCRCNVGEKKDDEALAKKIAALCDVYVNDAFGTAHRAEATTALIAEYFPNDKMFGYVMESEIKAVDKVLEAPEHPFTAILGGSKVSSKITIIERLLTKVNNLVIGGGMSFTFIKAQGGKIGKSICEDDQLPLALDILKKAAALGVNIYLPTDVVIADDFSETANTKIADINAIPDEWEGVDAAPASIDKWRKVLLESKTILWNGPVGVFEIAPFANGTKAIAQIVAEATAKGAYSLVGGGDSVAAVNQMGFADKVSYVSTGGGALLEYMEGIELPGVKAIRQ